MLPKHHPPCQTVQGCFHRWSLQGIWRRIQVEAVRKVRQTIGTAGPQEGTCRVDSTAGIPELVRKGIVGGMIRQVFPFRIVFSRLIV